MYCRTIKTGQLNTLHNQSLPKKEQKTNKFSRKWWKRGTGSELIGAMILVLAMVFMAGFANVSIKAIKTVRLAVTTDAIADGSVVYGNLKSKYDHSRTQQMASQLTNYNSTSWLQLSSPNQSVYEDNSIVDGKTSYVVTTTISGSNGNTFSNTVIALPKSAHEIALAALDHAKMICDDNSRGYNNAPPMLFGDLDCGTFIVESYLVAGVNIIGYNAWGNREFLGIFIDGDFLIQRFYREFFLSRGFEILEFSYDDLLEGDILMNRKGGHTEMYMGEGRTIGAHDNYDGKHGDFTYGTELSPGSVFGRDWKWIIRYVGEDY